jgi:membrane protein required for beta-lactamase induction
VFFWYVVLGVVGALVYRLSERLGVILAMKVTKTSVEQLMKSAYYPVAWMMVVSLAIASDLKYLKM